MKQYLGDAVYVSDELNPGHITLTTGSHRAEKTINIIHLEPEVFNSLVEFLENNKKMNDCNALI